MYIKIHVPYASNFHTTLGKLDVVLFSGEKVMRHLAVGSDTIPMIGAIHHH